MRILIKFLAFFVSPFTSAFCRLTHACLRFLLSHEKKSVVSAWDVLLFGSGHSFCYEIYAEFNARINSWNSPSAQKLKLLPLSIETGEAFHEPESFRLPTSHPEIKLMTKILLNFMLTQFPEHNLHNKISSRGFSKNRAVKVRK